MICTHCEKSSCYCDKPRTISSADAEDDVKNLAVDLSPAPISNERLWYVIEEHLGPKRREIALLRATIKHQDRILEHYEKEENEPTKVEGTQP